ncbi:non-ribosomal peptide synthetase [Kitasatospora sp. NPDC127111]|uniref:non-ribosomal peptide synthetase n=1 Tax=Kitasatospora sp. NPDC127111 TaxID=3345363 RepID=UPI0036408B13
MTDTTSPLPRTGSPLTGTAHTWVPDLIDARADADGPAVALRTADGELGYAELRDRADRTARDLTDLGVGTGDLVGIRLPAGPALVVAMLAVWRAGAAFLPMDAAAPDEYCARLLRDSGAAAVFDRGERPAALPTARRGAALDPAPAPGDRPAYVIYTSGSTGAPKGVVVGHRALAGHVAAAVDLFALDRQDVVLQFASAGFDVAQEEIWPTLAAGGTLAFRSAGAPDAAALAAQARALGVTVLQLPTAYWRLLCTETAGGPDGPRGTGAASGDAAGPDFTGVRTVVIGGESATANDVDVHRRGPLGHTTLVNGYGPTETVITATALVLRPGQPVPGSTGLPIGGPLGERLLYLLDEEQRPVPDGVPGELWIGGPLLAAGYLHDPGRTAERFRPDPFAAPAGTGSGPDARMYRTGDQVVRRADGELEFLGRLDNQVKVRGHRIELDEVDRHLLDTPGVTAAAAVTLDDGAGGLTLGAGISRTPDGPTAEELRDRLRPRLPAYMVPGPIFVFDRLPLTPSGKIDRRAVAALAAAEHTPAPADHPAPEGQAGADAPVVDQLLGLLRELLRDPAFGVDDDFLAHGGDSLMALRVSGTLRERGWRLRPSDLLTGGTARVAAERARALTVTA